MKNLVNIKIFLLGVILIVTLNAIDTPVSNDLPDHQQMLALLSLLHQGKLMHRAPTPPSGLTSPLGSVNFQAYNGGPITPYTPGANIITYYGQAIAPTPGQTLPANVIMSTVPTINVAPTPRVFIGANGRVGIGNFGPTNGAAINAALHVEGDNASGVVAASADNALHVGLRTPAINAFVTSATGSAQVDGNLFVAQNTQTQRLTGYGVFDPINYIPIRQITTPVVINEFPYTISAPGKYEIYQDTAYAASGAVPAITIASSNVVLDLQGFELMQSTATLGVIGIQVNANQSNITIRNGKINGFTSLGINVSNAVNAITVQDMLITGCGGAAVSVGINGNNVTLQDLRINNCAFTTGTVMAFTTVNGLQCDDCAILNCAITGSLVGIQCTTVANSAFSRVAMGGCSGATSFTGFNLSTGTQNLSFKNCSVTGNSSTSTCTGFASTGGATAARFINYAECSYIGNSAGETNLGWSSIADSTFFDCVVFSNRLTNATGTTYNGFNPTSECVLLNCLVSNATTADTASVSRGIEIAGNNNAVINSLASSNNTNATTSIGINANAFAQTLVRGCNVANHPIAYSGNATFAAIENLATTYTTPFSGFPVGSNQTQPNIGTLTSLATQNPWLNTGVN